jgi:vitamin B12 transporter
MRNCKKTLSALCFRLSTTLIILLLSMGAISQTSISGRIKDYRNRPIQGVSVSIKDSYDGGSSDSTGRFSFRTSESGAQLLVASSIGYKSFEQKVTLDGSSIVVDIVMKEEINELKAVIITAGSFEASDEKKGTVLKPLDIVTTASANADITGALKTLPGTQNVGETEGLFVRGGTASESKVFIDGTLVNSFFYSSVPDVSQRGRFSPFLFKGTVFSTGGYSALYGQALSSALILESIDLPDRAAANLGITPLGISGGYQSLSKDKKSSWGFNYGYTNLTAVFKVIKQRQDYFNMPQFHTAEANFRIKTSKSGMIKYYGTFSQNSLGLRNPSLDSLGLKDVFSLTNYNVYHNISYKERIALRWKINAGISFTNNRDEIAGELQDAGNNKTFVNSDPILRFKNFGIDAKGNYVQGKIVLERKLRGLSAIRFGSEYLYSDERSTFTLYDGTKFNERVKENLKAAFAETDIYLTNDLAAKIGGRLEHSTLLDRFNVAPRLSLAYKLRDQGQASFAYGIFYQNPERRYLPTPANLTFTKATHYIAQYQRVVKGRLLRTELFYKQYDNLLKTGFPGTNKEVAINNNGFGDAKGFEVFWRDKKTFSVVDYWVSYSFLDTKRDFLNFPNAVQPTFAAKHTASLVVKTFFTGIKTGFNGTYNYSSGRPYFNPNRSSNEYLKDRTSDFHSVSFSLNYLPNLGKKGASAFTVIVFSISNVLGAYQVFGYNYSSRIKDGAGQFIRTDVTPASKRFVFIGAFISFGVDRSQDVINNNL